MRAASGEVIRPRQELAFLDRFCFVVHFVLVVELHQGEGYFALTLLLLVEHFVDPFDRVVFVAAHRTGSVQQERDVGQVRPNQHIILAAG